MKRLYYVTAYQWDANEWWRFAVSAASEEAALAAFREGYSDTRFHRVGATFICETPDDIFTEL